MCACKSKDAYDCWSLRYRGHPAFAGTEQQIECEGGPCECECHQEDDDDSSDYDWS